MSGLAALLAGRETPGAYLWRSGLDVDDVRQPVEHAGWVLGHVDGWVGDGSRETFLADVGRALDFPAHYGQNFDALADCLRDLGAGAAAGVVLLWDGWSTLARHDERAFGIALDVLGERAGSERGVPFAVLLRGDGPVVPGLRTLE